MSAPLVAHPAWGVIALPPPARLDVREGDLPGIDPRHRPAFRTELEPAIASLRRAEPWPDLLSLPTRAVADGAYAERGFLKPAMAPGMTVVGRLRNDAALWTSPGPRPDGKRGRPRTYGEDVAKTHKTFLATWRPAGGAIRVVPVGEPTGGRARFCTDTQASVGDLLGMVADRSSLEITSRECEQVVGAGQQQVRSIGADIGASHICAWTLTMTEAWAWSRGDEELVDRSTSPRDSALRRPGHADKRYAWRRGLVGEEIRAALRAGATEAEMQATAERLLRLAA